MTALNKARETCQNSSYEEFECLTVFSGDLLGPSLLSNTFEGAQMIKPFKECMVDIAMPGNHELDYGVEHMMKLLSQTMPL